MKVHSDIQIEAFLHEDYRPEYGSYGIYGTGYNCDHCYKFNKFNAYGGRLRGCQRWTCNVESCVWEFGGYDYCFGCVPKTGNHPKI